VLLSVVIPLHNEAPNLDALFARLTAVLEGIGMEWEIVCVDDGSSDDTLPRLAARHAREARLRVVGLSRNFGKEIAVAAGLRFARGDAVVLMDGDLQHPPELIETFLARWREGYAMVYAQRTDRRNESKRRRWAAALFYRLFASLGDVALPAGAGDFRLFDRKVVEVFNSFGERTRFNKGLYAWLGFRQIGVPFDVPERNAGATSWNFSRLARFAIDGLMAFTTVPLRIWSYIGVLVSLGAIGYGVFFLVKTLILGIDVPGYPSLIVAIMSFAGIQLISLGIIGEYLAQMVSEVKRRPLFIVSELHGFENRKDAPRDAPRDAVVHRIDAAG
jgi:glycosyltransferase involved in cell wall biosynthesis